MISPRIADPENLLGADDEGSMATYLSMPLRARGRVVGILVDLPGPKVRLGSFGNGTDLATGSTVVLRPGEGESSATSLMFGWFP